MPTGDRRTPGIFLLLFGSLFFVSGAGIGVWEWRFAQRAESTAGTVVRYDEQTRMKNGRRNTLYSPVFAYDVGGRQYEVKSNESQSSKPYEIGSRVDVLYDPDNPGRGQIRSFVSQWLLPLAFSAVGLVVAAVGGFLLAWQGRA